MSIKSVQISSNQYQIISNQYQNSSNQFGQIKLSCCYIFNDCLFSLEIQIHPKLIS